MLHFLLDKMNNIGYYFDIKLFYIKGYMPTHYPGTPEELRALDAYIKLSRSAEAVTAQVNAHLREFGLTISQFGALEALYHLGPMQPGELGVKILKSGGDMTLVIDNLAKRGLVQRERQEADRRCITIHLTEQGRELIAQILPEHIQAVVQTFTVLSAGEQEQLAALCKRVGLQESNTIPAMNHRAGKNQTR